MGDERLHQVLGRGEHRALADEVAGIESRGDAHRRRRK
jgi:hypothetical protein